MRKCPGVDEIWTVRKNTLDETLRGGVTANCLRLDRLAGLTLLLGYSGAPEPEPARTIAGAGGLVYGMLFPAKM